MLSETFLSKARLLIPCFISILGLWVVVSNTTRIASMWVYATHSNQYSNAILYAESVKFEKFQSGKGNRNILMLTGNIEGFEIERASSGLGIAKHLLEEGKFQVPVLFASDIYGEYRVNSCDLSILAEDFSGTTIATSVCYTLLYSSLFLAGILCLTCVILRRRAYYRSLIDST